ncbi:ADP-ribosylation factor-like protein 16 isoform X1 [Petromyzon marinus]|uniref:ADP-ribosylation factor-like protein 16 isoform X1 n=2 Tax=Petromyzon marinus TaxID=7757 RepID=UPI003F7190EE
MLLLLGPTGSGKTLLLKRLQKIFAGERVDKWEAPSTVPTVGTNLVDVAVGKRRLTLRELGGTMAPIWDSYYKHSTAVINHRHAFGVFGCCSPFTHAVDNPSELSFVKELHISVFVVDVANPRQLASAGVQLWEVLAHEEVRGKALCVLLNKTDLATSGAVREFRSLLRLDDPEATAAVTTSPPENHADDDDDDVAEGKREAGKVAAGVAAATARVNVLGGSARDGAGVTELAEWIRRLAARR